jgi:methionyl-tRNA synthetase
MSRVALRLICDGSNCEYEEFPVRHRLYSNCGGYFYDRDGEVVCSACNHDFQGVFKCDRCGKNLDMSNTEEEDYYGS